MVTAEGIAVRTYDVSDFQRGSQARALGLALGAGILAGRKGIQWTGDGTHSAGGDPQVSCRSGERAMPQKQLNGAHVCAGFEQVRGKGMSQTVWVRGFGQAGMKPRMSAGLHHMGGAERLIKPPSRE